MTSTDFFSAPLLTASWLLSIFFAIFFAGFVGIFRERLDGIRRLAVGLMVFPGFIFAILYAARGFGILDRPLVHWIFPKGAVESFRLGMFFDPTSFIAVISFSISAAVIGFRNRPTLRMSSAMAFSWAGIGLAATAQTLWFAILGMGIQLFGRIFPLIESGGGRDSEDTRWFTSAKRGWIGIAFVMCGGAGLATQGVRLDFLSDVSGSASELSAVSLLAGGILIFGLLILATPALGSHALYDEEFQESESSTFVSEASLAWIAVLVLYRLNGIFHEQSWALFVGVGAAISVGFSIIALLFQTKRTNANHLWLSTLPVTTLLIIPFIPSREASLYLWGSLIAFAGLWITLDHRRKRIDVALAVAFWTGFFGLVGWATSTGFSTFFSKIQEEPVLRISILLLFLLLGAIGTRLVLLGGDHGENESISTKWIAAGIFFVLGFGPILSGHWSGSSIPGEPDWIEEAKN